MGDFVIGFEIDLGKLHLNLCFNGVMFLVTRLRHLPSLLDPNGVFC